MHFVMLAAKVGTYDIALREKLSGKEVDATRLGLRRQLPSNIFVQFLAGPSDIREGGPRLAVESGRLDLPLDRPGAVAASAPDPVPALSPLVGLLGPALRCSCGLDLVMVFVAGDSCQLQCDQMAAALALSYPNDREPRADRRRFCHRAVFRRIARRAIRFQEMDTVEHRYCLGKEGVPIPTSLHDLSERHFVKLVFRDCMSKDCVPTTARRIPISQFVDESERCKASNQ
jgi:hypothetical protein